MAKLKLVLEGGTTIDIAGDEDAAYLTYAELRKNLEDAGTKFKVYRRKFLRWERLYTINDLKLED